MKFPQTQIDRVVFAGGLDLVSPPLSMPPGYVREAQNYEIGRFGGYRRTDGYERFDGRLSPSDAVYVVLACTFSAAVVAGNTITGLTSGATGYVIAVEAAAIIFTKGTGTFQSGESIQVSAVTKATSTAAPVTGGASSPLLHAQYNNLAADAYRSDITAVTGSGAILGIRYLGSTLYAFRNNAGGTAAALYKSSGSGWTAVALGRELAFTSGGTYVVAEGNTITGATSGATAVITRVALASGSWAAGTAAGRFIFASQTGTFQAENLNVGGNLDVATIAGNASDITLSPSGRYRFVNYNFGSGLRIYGVDGVNRGFEFDGTVFVPISTGMTTDTPAHVAAHKNHLVFTFGHSLQTSGIGTPYAWTILAGASELNLGDTVTNILPQAGDAVSGGALMCFTRSKTLMLYGNSSANWNLVTLQHDAGALAHTAQNIAGTYVLDDRGITSLAASQDFGNFSAGTVSDRVQPWLVTNKPAIKDSCLCHEKNQYRLFFDGGLALFMTMVGRKVAGFMPMYFPDDINLAHETELTDGTEAIFYADSAGYVYQAEKGTSFDGDNIEAYLSFVFNHMQGPRTNKQYRKAVLEVGGTGYAGFYVSADLGYGNTEIPQVELEAVVASLSAGQWDQGTWDAGFWDGRILQPTEKELTGTAENIGLRIAQTLDYYEPLTFHGALIHYTPRRLLR